MAGRAELERAFEGLPGVTLRVAEPVARHSALRIGGEVEAWVLARDEAAVKAALSALRSVGLTLRPHQPLGDPFAREEGLSGAMLRLGPAFGGIEVEDEILKVGAAAPLARLGVVAQRAGLTAWGPVRSWPGTLAAWLRSAPVAELEPLVRSVRTLVGRSVKDRPASTLAGLSPKAVILAAELEARPDRPLAEAPPWPGSVCAMSPELERAMRRSRLPGLRLRSIRLAHEQIGLVANLGGGTSRDLDLILKLVQDRCKRDHGLDVEPRLQPLGRPPRTPRAGLEGWP